MKLYPLPRLKWLLPALVLLPLPGQAQLFSVTQSGLNLVVPDGNPFGVSHTATVDVGKSGLHIEDLAVSLDLSGGWAGDLYVQLTHDSGFSVLLNRVGRTATDSFGYGESSISIRLEDTPGLADVHLYRTALGGPPSTPVPGGLTGLWAPDGRATDPAVASDTDPRTAGFSSFTGLDPNGQWTLHLLDQDPGSEFTLHSWSLEFMAVPEPQAVLVTGALLLVLGITRRVKRICA